MNRTAGWAIVRETVKEFFDDKVLRLSAALAYYALFSLGPLLIIVVGLTGLAFGHESVQKNIEGQLQSLVGTEASKTIESMMSVHRSDTGLIATIAGVVVLLFGASGVFGQLQDALNTIWEVKAKPGQGVWGFIRNRFLSFAMVLGIGFLLLISLVLSAILSSFASYIGTMFTWSPALAHSLDLAVSFVVFTLLFAMIFKILPDALVAWCDVWIGAVGTTLLFTIGKILLGFYLGRESMSSAYGAAGSVVIILLWIYYSSLILLGGAEFTQVYARRLGSGIRPSKGAEFVDERSREKEGIPHIGSRSAENA